METAKVRSPPMMRVPPRLNSVWAMVSVSMATPDKAIVTEPMLSRISHWQDSGLGAVREDWNGRVRDPDFEIDAKGNPKKGKGLRHHLTDLSA